MFYNSAPPAPHISHFPPRKPETPEGFCNSRDLFDLAYMIVGMVPPKQMKQLSDLVKQIILVDSQQKQ